MVHEQLPVIGVGAVVWKENRVLMIRRANAPGAGHWSIPGGRLEFGETTEQAMLREIMEETAVTCETLALIGVYDAFVRDNAGLISDHFCLINYAAKWLSGAPVAGDDALDARFMTLDEINELEVWGEVRGAIRDSEKHISSI